MIARLGLSLAVFLLLSYPAHAASFDCAKASSAMEKTICADPNLSKLDEQLAVTYEAALKPLDENEKKVIRETQRKWADNVAGAVKTIPTLKQSEDANDRASFLEDVYKTRIGELTDIYQSNKPFTFYQVRFHLYWPMASSDPDEPNTRDGECTISFPLIDRPTNAGQKRFNSILYDGSMKRLPKCGGQNEEDSITAEAPFVSEQAISLQIKSDECCGAHGVESIETGTVLLADARDLKPDDVFNSKTSWKDALTRMVYQAALEDYTGNNLSTKEEGAKIYNPEKEWKSLITSGEGWYLDPKGLGFSYGQYILGPYVAGEVNVLIPWAKLKPYLNPNSPITLPPN